MKTKIETRLMGVCVAAVLLLCGLFVWFAAGQSLFMTGKFSHQGVVLFTADWPVVHLVVFGALTMLSVWSAKKQQKRSRDVLRSPLVRRCLLGGYCLALAAFVVFTQLATRADSWYTMDSAQALLRGDTSPLEPGGYISRYPNQKGFLMYLMLGLRVFGQEGTLGFQLLNVGWIALAIVMLVKLWKELFEHSNQTIVLLAVLAFLPLGLYVTYVYGNLPGLALSLTGMYALSRYLATWHLPWAVVLVVALGLAVQFKSNCSIMMLACLIVLILHGIFSRKWQALAAALTVVLCAALMAATTDTLLYTRYGVQKTAGTPTLAWVAMGLQHAPGRTEGFYNDYINSTYDGKPQTTELGEQSARDSIHASLAEYTENPLVGFRFFSRKNAAQWNESTFRALNTNRGRTTENGKRLPAVLVSLLHEGGLLYGVATEYCNLYLTQLWLGVLLCFILGWNGFTLLRLLPAIAFLGGMLFHTVWEGNSEYTWPYAVLMIPYAVRGFALLGQALTDAQLHKKVRASVPLRCCGVLALSFVCMGVSGVNGTATRTEIAQDTALQLLDVESAQPILAEGVYTVQGKDGWICAQSLEDGSVATLTTDPSQALRLHIYCSRYSMTADDCYYMITTEQQPSVSLGLCGSDEEPMPGIRGRWIDEKDKKQQWKLLPLNGGFVLINENSQSTTEDDRVLSCDAGQLCLTAQSDYSWQLQPVQ